MKKLTSVLQISLLVLLQFPIFFCRTRAISAESPAVPADAGRSLGGTPMHKVQLTQKGYIQFLRWELPVPAIHEFTFCLWMKSNDLKHPHSILSYSRNERERLIRSWISPRGRSVHLEIDGAEVFGWPVSIREHRWYHICQSWENRVGRYALWLDGRLELQGYSEQMIDHVIPEGGDIVLGQEYTDFDKGLEEGIEGSVFGFNLLTVSAFEFLDTSYRQESLLPRDVAAADIGELYVPKVRREVSRRDLNHEKLRSIATMEKFVSERLALGPNWSRRIFRKDDTRAPESAGTVVSTLRQSSSSSVANDTLPGTAPIRRDAVAFGADHAIGEIAAPGKSTDAPLGLQLVKLSYVRCELGRGSPPIGGPLMLISWSRTPVKVFGGATIKNIGNKCGDF